MPNKKLTKRKKKKHPSLAFDLFLIVGTCLFIFIVVIWMAFASHHTVLSSSGQDVAGTQTQK